MSDCCSAKGYRWVFSERMARAEAKRYRRKGLDSTTRRIFELVRKEGVEGRTVLEVGGGIGALQLELLKAGATRAVSVELTPTYEVVAGELIAETGMTGRVERKVMDFAQASSEVEGADLVILNRVLCCYHDMPRLAGVAADHARQMLVLSYPKRAWWTVLGLGIGNVLLALTRREFHIFVHRPTEIIATSERHGLEPLAEQRGLLWIVTALKRAA